MTKYVEPKAVPRREKSGWAGRLLVGLLYVLPHQLLSRLVYIVTRSTWRPGKNALIRWFIRSYRVDLGEAEIRDPESFSCFNEFFTRKLAPGVRPLPTAADRLISPADGTVSQCGALTDGQLIQAKGRYFSVAELLGGDVELARSFERGCFITIYLSPRDYHRVHMPVAGRLRSETHVPGRLYSVQDSTARLLDRLYLRNERGVFVFDSEIGPLAVVMVGAIFVSSIDTAWGGTLNPHGQRSQGSRRLFTEASQQPVVLKRGDELGSFNMGSTVILLVGEHQLRWLPEVRPGGKIRFGDVIAEPGSGGPAAE